MYPTDHPGSGDRCSQTRHDTPRHPTGYARNQVMASITVSAGQLLVKSGGMLVLTGGGQTVSSVAATGSDTITVSSGGLVSGLSIGSGTITVRAGGVTSNITVGSGGQRIWPQAARPLQPPYPPAARS